MGGENSDGSLNGDSSSNAQVQELVSENVKNLDQLVSDTELLKQEENKNYQILFKNMLLSDPGFSTRASDPRIMTGLAAFIKYNDIKLNSVIIEGGLFPHMWEYTSKRNDKDQMYLGNDPLKTPESKDDYYLFIKPKENPEQKASDEANFENNVKQKIKSYHEVIEVNKAEFKKLEKVLNEDVAFHYVHGTEDINNMAELRFIKIANAKMQKKDEEKIIANINSIEKEISDMLPIAEYSGFKKDFMKNLISYTRNGKSEELKSKTQKEISDYISSLFLKVKDKRDFAASKPEYIEKIKTELVALDSIEKLVSEYDLIKSEAKKYSKELKHAEKEKRDLELTIDARARVKKTSFYRLVKKVPVTPITQELVFREVKQEYNELLYEVSPLKFRPNFHIHSSILKALVISGKDGSKSKGSDMIYSPLIDSYYPEGYKLLLAYNLNTKSSVPNRMTLKQQKLYAHLLNKMQGLYNENVLPDAIISGNGIGGFRFQQQQKYTENTVIGEERKTPESITHISLPTLLSYEKLINLKEKGLNVASVKRFSEGLYASGAVIHSLRSDYVEELEYIDTSELIKMGELELEIEAKEKKLSWKNLKEETKDTIRNEIEQLKNKIKINTKSIEISGDVHIGSSNEPGRPTNYDFERATQRYQRQNGLPDLLVASEYLHGSLKRGFDSDTQYFADVPSENIDLLNKIKGMNIPSDEKSDLISRIAENIQSRIPLPRLDLQLKEAKRLVIPYFKEVLDKGGKVFLVSGNHNNKTNPKYDEAEMLAMVIPDDEKYKENNQLLIASGIGEQYGSGTIRLENGKKLYSAHKPFKGVDEVIGAMQQMLNANIDAYIAVFFDLHHGGGGFADGTFFNSANGKEPWMKYVDAIGKTSSVRGSIIFLYDPEKRYGKWVNLTDRPLEKSFMPEYNRFAELKDKHNLKI